MDKSGITLTSGKSAQSGSSTIPGGLGNAVDILNATQDLNEIKSLLTIKGEIIALINEDTVRVRTERGDVDVRLRDGQNRPREGQRVEIEIKPGSPPKEAIIKQAGADIKTPRSSATPVEIDVKPAITSKESPFIQTVKPFAPITSLSQIEPGTNVRLEPVTPQQVSALLSAKTEAEVQAVLQQAVAQTEVPAPQAPQAPVVDGETAQTATAPPPAAPVVIKGETSTPPPTPAAPEAATPAPAKPESVVRTVLENIPVIRNFLPPAPATVNLDTPITTARAEAAAPAPAQPQAQAAPVTTLPDGQIVPAAADGTPLPSIRVRIESTDLPRMDAATTRAQQNSTAVRGVVIGSTPQNLPVINVVGTPQTAEGAAPLAQNYVMHIPVTEAAVGGQIEFTPQGPITTTLPTAAGIAPPLPLYLTPGQWPVMQELSQTLMQSAPAQAQVLSNITPSPSNPTQMTPAALFFVAAMRAGDIGSWLGDKTIDILRQTGKGDLLKKLSSEGGLLNRLSSEPVTQEWRALPLPMMWDNEMQKVSLFYRHEDSESEAKDSGKQTRFIMDLKFSNIGPVQVDGLFRDQRLDIILRTEDSFSQVMQMEMRRTYAEALRQTQIAGELNFQDQPDQWVKVNVEDDAQENLLA